MRRDWGHQAREWTGGEMARSERGQLSGCGWRESGWERGPRAGKASGAVCSPGSPASFSFLPIAL